MHNINTRNKHHLHRPVANLSCFQKGASYSGIRIFNSLPRIITNLKNKKTQFKVALKKFLNSHFFYSVNELFTCTDVSLTIWLCKCILQCNNFNVYMFMTCSTSYCLVTLKDLWNVYMYVCMYVYIYICMYVCINNWKHNFPHSCLYCAYLCKLLSTSWCNTLHILIQLI